MAPEQFNNKPYTNLVDIWALGIIFDELLVYYLFNNYFYLNIHQFI